MCFPKDLFTLGDQNGKFEYSEKLDIYSFGQSLRCLLKRSCNLDPVDKVNEDAPFLTNLISL